MANHISSKKRIRRNSRMEVVNKNRKNRVRTFIKKVELAIQNGDKILDQDAFKEAQPEMHRSITKGIFKKNTISRKLSRLSIIAILQPSSPEVFEKKFSNSRTLLTGITSWP